MGIFVSSRGVKASLTIALNFLMVSLTDHLFTPKPIAITPPVLEICQLMKDYNVLMVMINIPSTDHKIEKALNGQLRP